MSDDNKTTEGDEGSSGTNSSAVSIDDYNKVLARAQKFEGQLVDLKKQLEPFKGIDLQALKAKAEERDMLVGQQTGKSKEDLDKLLSEKELEVRRQLDPEISSRDERINSLQAENRELKVVDRAFFRFSGRCIDEAHEELKDKIRSTFDIDAEGREIVKDENGKPLPSNQNGKRGEPMGWDEFIDKLEEKKKHWFKAKGSPGFLQDGQKTNMSSFSQTNAGMTAEQVMRLPKEQQAAAIQGLSDAEKGKLIMGAFFRK